MKTRVASVILAASAALFAANTAAAADVLVLSGGNATNDNEVKSALEGRGFNVTVGPEAASFDGGGLSGIEAVVLLTNYNWSGNGASMPDPGETALKSFIQNGGGLITSEWLIWRQGANQGAFPILAEAIPATSGGVYRSAASATYTQLAPNAILNAGLPASFSFNTGSLSGTESRIQPKSGATVFYNSDYADGNGLIGWGYGAGRVISFSTLVGNTEIGDANYRQLFGNAVAWAAAVPEPSTYMLLIAGLGLLALGRRRRAE